MKLPAVITAFYVENDPSRGGKWALTVDDQQSPGAVRVVAEALEHRKDIGRITVFDADGALIATKDKAR